MRTEPRYKTVTTLEHNTTITLYFYFLVTQILIKKTYAIESDSSINSTHSFILHSYKDGEFYSGVYYEDCSILNTKW